MKDSDLDELVADGMIISYEYEESQEDNGDYLIFTFPNGKRLRIETLSSSDVAVNIMVNLV